MSRNAPLHWMPAPLMCAATAAMLLAYSLPAASADISAAGPRIVVVDGDTLQVEGRLLSLANIDAPEIGQLCRKGNHLWACGMDAARALQKLLAMQQAAVVCRTSAQAGAPETAECAVGSADIAEDLVASGLAVAQPEAPAAVQRLQKQAEAAGLGIWSGSFVPPAQWRQGVRLAAERMAETSTSQWDGFPYKVFGKRILPVPRVHHAGCVLRARTTGSGAREFATPLDAAYKDMPTDRAFCSDEEAERAGWLHIGQTEPEASRSVAHR